MELVRSLILLSLIALPLLAEGGVHVGGWNPIKDVKDPEVVEIAKYAISEHNKQSKSDLRYERVVSGQKQVVAGMLYKLVISAMDGVSGKSSNYEAVVWEKSWMHFRNLKSFKSLD